MRVILILTAVFLIICLAKSVSSKYDEEDSDEIPKKILPQGGEEDVKRRKRSADFDYGGYDDDGDRYLN
uniref:Sperm protein 6kDa n=1 Tax=Haliotis cracherodii TaxID=6455 RepID=M9WAZ0_HALCR|nr:sperm protein 6kDa [Haliotis cracherodii]